jgi:hypothetical protein
VRCEEREQKRKERSQHGVAIRLVGAKFKVAKVIRIRYFRGG